MKFYFKTLFLIIFINCSNNKNPISDLELLSLNGNVKRIEHINYKGEVKFGKPVKTEATYKYSDKNKYHTPKIWILSKTNPLLGFRVDKEYLYEFNSSGNCIKKYDFQYSLHKPKLYNSFVFQDEILKEIVSFRQANNNSISSKLIIDYDEHNNPIRYNDNTGLGHVETIFNNVYRDNKLIESNRLDSIGRIKSNKIFDENEKILEINTFNENGKTTEKSTYKYDERNNLIEEIRYNESGDIDFKQTFEYNQINQIIYKFTEYISRERETEIFYEFNNKGFISKVINNSNFYGGNVSIKKLNFHYEYDNNKNWINQYTYDNEKLIHISERKIEYY
jgi:hypothetical protein